MASAARDVILFSVKPPARTLATSLPQAWSSQARSVVLSPASGRATLLHTIHSTLSVAPYGWIIAKGPAVALVHRVIVTHLGLRLSGAIFCQPAAWIGTGGRLELDLSPLPCPSVVVGDCEPASRTAEHVLAWGSSWVPRLSRGDLEETPAIRDMIALRRMTTPDRLHP